MGWLLATADPLDEGVRVLDVRRHHAPRLLRFGNDLLLKRRQVLEFDPTWVICPSTRRRGGATWLSHIGLLFTDQITIPHIPTPNNVAATGNDPGI